jgi:hypothetical protein
MIDIYAFLTCLLQKFKFPIKMTLFFSSDCFEVELNLSSLPHVICEFEVLFGT